MVRKYSSVFKFNVSLLEESLSIVNKKLECTLDLQKVVLDEINFDLTIRSDANWDIQQILQLKEISPDQISKHPLSDYIVYVALTTQENVAGGTSETEETLNKCPKKRNLEISEETEAIQDYLSKCSMTTEQFIIENGFSINYGNGKSIRYRCLERDGSFTEECVLSFVEEELEKVMVNRRRYYNLYKFDICLLESSLVINIDKLECILNFPALYEAVKETSYALITRDSDSMTFHQIKQIKGISLEQIQQLKDKKLNIAQAKEDSLMEHIVYVSFSTLDNAAGSSYEVNRIVSNYRSKQKINKAEMAKAVRKHLSEKENNKTIEQFIFENGFSVDFGGGKTIRYKRFERSGSMAKKCELSFVEEELEKELTKRIVLLNEDQLKCGNQLSKWAAYKGLSMSGAIVVEGLTLDHETVIVIKDGFHSKKLDVITAKEANNGSNDKETQDGSEDKELQGKKEYILKKEEKSKITINQFDGAGFISFDYANKVESYLAKPGQPRGLITSFQFRLPFCKGMLHKVDFESFFRNELNQDYIIDVWGKKHDISKVEIILTESQFKAKKWLVCEHQIKDECPKDPNDKSGRQIKCSFSQEDGCTMWKIYWKQFDEYNYKFYISNHNKPDSGQVRANHLNYQVLHTLDIEHNDFVELLRNSMTDYWKLKNNDQAKLIHLLKLGESELQTPDTNLINEEDNSETPDESIIESEQDEESEDDDPDSSESGNQLQPIKTVEDAYMGALRANPSFLREQSIKLRVSDILDQTKRSIRSGNFPVNALTLFFSPDLLRLLLHSAGYEKTETEDLYKDVCMPHNDGWFYAPGLKSSPGKEYSIIRNPHVSRNEHAVCKSFVPDDSRRLYKRYFSHLSGVCMVNPADCIAERLSGADYDGDIVKVIDNPLFIEAARNDLLWIKIPDPKPKSVKGNKEEKEWRVCIDTFKNEIGLYTTYAFGIAARAYGNKSMQDEKKQYEEKLNLMTILIGLEIDSAKTGVKPYISAELRASKEKFLYFKNGVVSSYLEKRYENALERGRARDTECHLNRLHDEVDRLLKSDKAKTRAMAFKLADYVPSKSTEPSDLQKGEMLALALAYHELRIEYNARMRFKEPYRSERHSIRKILEKQGHIEQGDITGAEKLIEENSKIFSSLKTSEIYDLYEKQRDIDIWAFTKKSDRASKLREYMKGFGVDIPNKDYPFYEDFNYSGYDLFGRMLKNEMDNRCPKEKRHKTRNGYKKSDDFFEKRLKKYISDEKCLSEIKERLSRLIKKRFLTSDKDLRDTLKQKCTTDEKIKFIKGLKLSKNAEDELRKFIKHKYSVLYVALSYERNRRERKKALEPFHKVNNLVGANLGKLKEDPAEKNEDSIKEDDVKDSAIVEERFKCETVDKIKKELELKTNSQKPGYIGYLAKACQEMALRICGHDAEMVVDLCLDSDINAIMPNNRFFWDIAGKLALENNRFLKKSNFMLPELVVDGNGDRDGSSDCFEYMFRHYKKGDKIDD